MKIQRYMSVLVLIAAAGIAGYAVGFGSRNNTVHAQTNFTNASLKGSFGFTLTGIANGSSGVAGFGTLNADGNGGVTGAETMQSLGGEPLLRPFHGTYAINGDGTGMLTLTYTDSPDADSPLPQSAHYSFVVVGGGKQLQSIRNDAGLLGNATFTMQ